MSRKDAVDYIKKEDENRKEYISAYFHKDVEDPLLYDFVLNTSSISHEEASEIICNVVMKKFQEYFIRETLNDYN